MNRRLPLTTRSLAIAALLALIAACGDESRQAAPAPAPQADHHHESLAAAEPVSGQSLHQLTAPWTDQQGETVRLADFADQIVVLAMVYTHCDNACPRIIADMRSIRKAFPDKAGNMAFVLASIDPERDTVTHLKQFGQQTGLSEQGWRLLRAPDDTVRELAAVLGVQYRRISEIDFAHSNIITVLGTSGEIRHQQQGLGTAPDDTVAMIRKLHRTTD